MEESNIPNKQSQQTIQKIVIKLAEQKTKHMPAKQHNHSQTNQNKKFKTNIVYITNPTNPTNQITNNLTKAI